jgi:MoxR-like ATPase
VSEDEKSTFPVFFGYPKMPSGRKLGGKRPLVGRDKLLTKVKQRLLEDDNVALHGGLPGCGKTEMAAQLVKDAQLKEHFKDGILWIGLGDKLRNEDVLRGCPISAQRVGGACGSSS